ncbi:MAG TPA: HAMP domain-containing sensor histidine kinase [Kofleriaceae bacterium]
MRRILLVNALIFAVLAAAVALAYYGYAATTEATSREREEQLLRDLADEKVLNIEYLVNEADTKLLTAVDPEKISEPGYLDGVLRSAGAATRSLFVFDSELKLVPGGYWSARAAKAGNEFRTRFVSEIVPRMPMVRQALGVRGHYYTHWDGDQLGQSKPYLFSFMRRAVGDHVFYVVIEDDLGHLITDLFPQFFVLSSPRLYQVVDDRGELRYGVPFGVTSGELVVTRQFVDTVDGWTLRVTQKDLGDALLLQRKKILDSLLIGGAVAVILVGLGFLAFAIRRERRLNELKSEFISNVSHELKTPLSIISLFGEMLSQGKTKSPEQAHEYAEIIWRESVRLGRLIDNVLDFARIERGAIGYEFAETDFTEVVERAIELSHRRVATAEMTLSADIEPDLPPVRLDANAFTLAVLNLIDNAIKYAPTGKKIELTVRREGRRVVLRVRDFGPGIDPEEHLKIFDRFYRARAIRLAPIRGSGIGLALVQHIARAHGGEAKVSSKLGDGATFSIALPISDKSES